MGLQPKPEEYERLWNQLRDFVAERLQTINSAERLAKMMAGKARLTKDVLFRALKRDEELQTELAGQFRAFKDQLIHDLTIEEFADIYAETIAYGMFAARLHDETVERLLARGGAATAAEVEPVPAQPVRLRGRAEPGRGAAAHGRRARGDIPGDGPAEAVRGFRLVHAAQRPVHPLLRGVPEGLQSEAKRKARGVWYTPEPVVNFIVRAVDDVLKEEFGLAEGLADTSKVTVDWDTGFEKKGKAVIEKREVHRVQILDPAAGTGTFLAEVIKQIAPRVRQAGGATWNRYVEEHLIPRLHGFELLMASYAMCHMKLDMMLSEMGYVAHEGPAAAQRLSYQHAGGR